MSDLHLAAGSKKPPLVDGKLRVYSMEFCPFAERARLVLLAKRIKHDIVNVNLKHKPEWIFELSSKGLVPILDTHTEVISESLDICDYLDEKYPEPPLYNPDTKEADRAIIKDFDELITLYYTACRKQDKTLAEYVNDDIMPHLKKLEDTLKSRGTFFGGDRPSMVDYMLWPWGERVDVLTHIYKEKLPVDETALPAIFTWCKAMRSLDPVKKTIISAERLYKASQFYKVDDPDYDGI